MFFVFSSSSSAVHVAGPGVLAQALMSPLFVRPRQFVDLHAVLPRADPPPWPSWRYSSKATSSVVAQHMSRFAVVARSPVLLSRRHEGRTAKNRWNRRGRRRRRGAAPGARPSHLEEDFLDGEGNRLALAHVLGVSALAGAADADQRARQSSKSHPAGIRAGRSGAVPSLVQQNWRGCCVTAARRRLWWSRTSTGRAMARGFAVPPA